MRITIDGLAIDSPDPDALAMFYEDLLGWVRTFEDDGEVMIASPDGSGFPLLFFEVDDPKTTKNRLHFDLRPDDQAAAVQKALDLGAVHVDIGQGDDPDTTWVVLADPDGNEFCILQPGAPADSEDLVAPADAVPISADDGTEFDDDDDDDGEFDDEDDWDDNGDGWDDDDEEE